jgi:hypothetical protein
MGLSGRSFVIIATIRAIFLIKKHSIATAFVLFNYIKSIKYAFIYV